MEETSETGSVRHLKLLLAVTLIFVLAMPRAPNVLAQVFSRISRSLNAGISLLDPSSH